MRIYVGNLPFTVDHEGLKKIFSAFDPQEVNVISDKYSGRSKGFGFIEIADDAQAKKAISEFNGKDIEGRELKVNEAKPKEERPRRDFGNRENRDGGRRRY